ncbi:probable polygalacturonase At1g80170 isoform X1 [Vigna umbellata]|uniref:probable polygalacturonase At1g80170 isoform X1 n=2 Tax=Vigna umbellata TaxID=87088 RepID=UPI001F5EFF9E|nr:probable polygalacturonase At1g80170 isoform X1 [Vigna umbellata]
MKNLRYCFSWAFVIIFIHVNVLVTPYLTRAEGFDSVIQHPRSRWRRTRTRSKWVLYVGDYGAKGDGLHNDTEAFLEAWGIACSLAGFINLVFPSGETFLIYQVDIGGPCRSKIILTISGTIVAPQDPAVWLGLNQRKWLYFHGVNHLTVDGGGSVNGMGEEWWARSCKINSTNPCHPAPTALTFHRCKDLKVRNLMLINSQRMHLSFTNCMRVVASHLKVLAPAFSPNTDGIHISASKGVQVRDSVIRTGDDCISIVRNSSRVWIRNIYCGPGHGISIGSLGKLKTWESVQNVIVEGAYLYNTDNGLRIKTWQGGSGLASKITFQNILMENVSNPIIIDQYYCDSQHPCENQTSAVRVENISFIDVQGTSASDEAIKFACSDISPCEDLYLENIFLVSCFGGNTNSFCWQAHGSARGFLYPPTCFSISDDFIRQNIFVESNHTIHSV